MKDDLYLYIMFQFIKVDNRSKSEHKLSTNGNEIKFYEEEKKNSSLFLCCPSGNSQRRMNSFNILFGFESKRLS